MALVGYWKLDGDAVDYSGYGNHGSWVGTESYDSGIYTGTNAADLDGSSYISIPNNTRIQTIYGHTISFWIYPITLSIRQSPIGKAYGGEGTVNLETGGYFRYYHGTAGGNSGSNGTTYTNLNTNTYFNLATSDLSKWYHVCIVRKNNQYIRIYIDGLLISESGPALASVLTASTNDLWLGSGYTAPMIGRLSEVRLFDHPISRHEVQILADRNSLPDTFTETEIRKSKVFHLNTDIKEMPIDMSGHASPVENRTYHQTGIGVKNNNSIYFSGATGNYIKGFISNLGREYTISCRVKFHSLSVATYPIFLSFGTPYLAVGTDQPIRVSFNDGSTQINMNWGTVYPETGTWYTVTYTHDGTTAKLYIDGILDASSVSANLGDLSENDFDLGRHRNNDTYRTHTEIEDVRIYGKALSSDDVLEIHNSVTSSSINKITRHGDVVTSGIDDDIEWQLMDNFISYGLDGGFSQYEASDALGGHAIQSASDLTAAGWNQYLTTFDHSSYPRINGFLQMYYSSAPNGYIEKTLPPEYDHVKVIWGNWQGGTSTLYIGGVSVQQAGNDGMLSYTGKYSDGDTIKFTETSMFYVSEVWVGKKKNKNNPLFSTKINLTNTCVQYRNRVAPYQEWVVGLEGNQPYFNLNGASNENRVIYSNDPWGNNTKVWDSPSNDTTSDADGGFNGVMLPIDNNYDYRFSVWVSRTVLGDGHFYFGTRSYNSSETLISTYRRSDNVGTTNPYFTVNTNWSEWGTTNEWYLAVGHVFNSSAGSGSNHIDSGIYDVYGDLIYDSDQIDYYWDNVTVYANIRSYLYYSTETNTKQRWVYPRIDKLDGNQPTILEIIGGFADVLYNDNLDGTNVPEDVSVRINNNNKLILKRNYLLR